MVQSCVQKLLLLLGHVRLFVDIPWKKEMATHSSIVWGIPWVEEPCGLQSMELQRVRQDWATITHTHS